MYVRPTDLKCQIYLTSNSFISSIAGNETTSATLSFTLFELARDLPLQKRLRQELRQFRPDSGEEPTYEDYQSRLPLLDAITKEA